MAEPTCPNRADHAEEPSGYLQWHEWAKRMSKTHKQSRCPGCGLWKIWTPKTRPTHKVHLAGPMGLTFCGRSTSRVLYDEDAERVTCKPCIGASEAP